MLSSAAATPPHQLRTATPPSYLSYSFPLPERRYVGLLACQRDPLLESLDAEVIRCDKVLRAPVAPAGKGKKAKAPVEELADEWEVELDDTVLFPEGGGQNSDRGTFTTLSPEGVPEGEPAQVRDVQRRNLDAVHFVSAPFPVGSRLRVQLDAVHRRDLMSQHTGQHLLSGVIDADLKLDTLSWSLTPAPQPCYIELPRAPTLDEIARIQQRCNDIISQGTPVSVAMHLAESGIETPGSKIPENYKGKDGQQGVVRVVEIHGLGDANPCCGTHPPSLAYLGSLFILPQTSSIRSTNARLSFLVGPRVLSHLAATHSATREAALELGCGTAELVPRVAALNLALRDATKREKRLREDVATSVAEGLVRNTQGEGKVLTGVMLREDDATNTLEFLVQVAAEIKGLCVDENGKAKKHVFALACGVPLLGNGVPTSAGGSLLVFGEEDVVAKVGKEIGARMAGRVKGGGKGRWQGKLVGARWEKGDRKLLEQILVDVAGAAKE